MPRRFRSGDLENSVPRSRSGWSAGVRLRVERQSAEIEPEQRPYRPLKRNAAALKAQRRHGRYRVEQIAMDNGLPKGSRHLFSPLINVLPFSEPAFQGCAVTRHVMSNGEPEGIDLTFRGKDDAGALSFGLSSDSKMFAKEPFDRHARDLPAFLDRAIAAEALAQPVEALLGKPATQGQRLARAIG